MGETAKNICSDLEQRIYKICRKHAIFVIVNVLFGCAIYYMLMAHDLVNDIDGVWHLSNYVAGKGEITSGRGLLRYVDKLHFGIVSAPFQTILTLIILSITNAIIMTTLNIEGGVQRFLLSFWLIANPVVCNTLTYGYTAIGYAVAYFFSVLSVAPFRYHKRMHRIIPCGMCIAISMSCYQAYLGVSCVMFLLFLMCLILEDEKTDVLAYMRDAFLGICLGGGMYYAFTQFMLWYSQTEFSSYRGIDSLTPFLMIKSLPKSILGCYNTFYVFFMKENMCINTSITSIILAAFLVIASVKIIFLIIWAFRKSFFSGVLMCIAILLIPVGSNASLLLAVGTTRTLIMSMGTMLAVVLIVISQKEQSSLWNYWSKKAVFLIMLLMLWISVSVVENDQLALKEGKDAVISLTDTIVDTLIEQGYRTDGSCAVVFLGRPADSSLFYRSQAYEMANYYAQFGYFSVMPGNNQRTWNSVLNNLCGKRIFYAYEEMYGKIREAEDVAAMPFFPQEGSIVKMGDVFVVKIAEPY